MNAMQTCELCGASSDSVRVQLAWYRADLARRIGMPEVQTAARCMDHEACRRRVIEGGEEWPLVLRGDAMPVPLPVVQQAPAPEPEPESEEAAAWFE